MAVSTIREYGRVLAKWEGGDPNCLLDTTVAPSEFAVVGSCKGRPDSYTLWRITLEAVYSERTGKPTGEVVLNIRKWVRTKPSDSNPTGFEGPVKDMYRGGISLPASIASGLADGFKSAATDAMTEKERLAAESPKSEVDRLRAMYEQVQAELAAVRAAEGGK